MKTDVHIWSYLAENEEDLKLPGRKGLEDCWGEKGLVEEEDWNDRDEWKKKIR